MGDDNDREGIFEAFITNLGKYNERQTCKKFEKWLENHETEQKAA